MSYQKELNDKRLKWKAIIDDFNKSDLSKVDYCNLNNLAPHLFYYWLKHFNKKSIINNQARLPTAIKVIPVKNTSVQKKKELPDPHWVAQFLVALNEANK